MNLSHLVRVAVLEAVRQLRDPDRDMSTASIGWLIVDELGSEAYRDTGNTPLDQVREALGVSTLSTLSAWALGKSREEVAQALERIATSPGPAR